MIPGSKVPKNISSTYTGRLTRLGVRTHLVISYIYGQPVWTEDTVELSHTWIDDFMG